MLHVLYRWGENLVLKLPLETSYKIAIFLADVYGVFARDDRRNLTENLRVVLGTDDEELIKKHRRNIFRNFAKYLVDFFRFSKLDAEYIKNNIQITGRENVDNALKKGKGVIMISAHIGNWELGAAVIAILGYPLHALVLDHADKRINDFFVRQRSACNVKPIGLGSQLRNCFRVLRKNEVLGIAGDRDFTNSGIRFDFFGHPTTLPKGAATLSLKTGAPVIPTFLIRKEDNAFQMTFEKPFEGEMLGNKEADTKNIMKGYFSAIEKYVKKFPDQWYAFKKIWQ